MGHQHARGDGMGLAVGRGGREVGQNVAHWRVHIQSARGGELQRPDIGQQLGDGSSAIERVRIGRHALGLVGPAKPLLPDDGLVAHDGDAQARGLGGSHFGLDEAPQVIDRFLLLPGAQSGCCGHG